MAPSNVHRFPPPPAPGTERVLAMMGRPNTLAAVGPRTPREDATRDRLNVPGNDAGRPAANVSETFGRLFKLMSETKDPAEREQCRKALELLMPAKGGDRDPTPGGASSRGASQQTRTTSQASAMMEEMGIPATHTPRAFVDGIGQYVMPCETPSQARARLARPQPVRVQCTIAKLPTSQASAMMAEMGVPSMGTPAARVDDLGQYHRPTETPRQARARLSRAA